MNQLIFKSPYEANEAFIELRGKVKAHMVLDSFSTPLRFRETPEKVIATLLAIDPWLIIGIKDLDGMGMLVSRGQTINLSTLPSDFIPLPFVVGLARFTRDYKGEAHAVFKTVEEAQRIKAQLQYGAPKKDPMPENKPVPPDSNPSVANAIRFTFMSDAQSAKSIISNNSPVSLMVVNRYPAGADLQFMSLKGKLEGYEVLLTKWFNICSQIQDADIYKYHCDTGRAITFFDSGSVEDLIKPALQKNGDERFKHWIHQPGADYIATPDQNTAAWILHTTVHAGYARLIKSQHHLEVTASVDDVDKELTKVATKIFNEQQVTTNKASQLTATELTLIVDCLDYVAEAHLRRREEISARKMGLTEFEYTELIMSYDEQVKRISALVTKLTGNH